MGLWYALTAAFAGGGCLGAALGYELGWLKGRTQARSRERIRTLRRDIAAAQRRLAS